MPLAAAKRSLDQRVKAALAENRRVAREKAAADKRSRAGKEKFQMWLDADLGHRLRLMAVNERTTLQALMERAAVAMLRE